MNYKSCLVQLVMLVALALTLLQYLTTTITFSVLGRTIVVKRKSENETLKLKIVSPEIRNHSKTTSSLNNQSHVSKKFAKLTHKKHTANQKLQKQVQQRNKVMGQTFSKLSDNSRTYYANLSKFLFFAEV